MRSKIPPPADVMKLVGTVAKYLQNLLNRISLTALMSGTSLAVLYFQALDVGLSAVIADLVQAYDWVLSKAFLFIEPHVRSALSALFSILSIDLDFHDYWKHIFVPLFAYVLMDARTNINMKNRPDRLSGTIFILTQGLAIMLIGSALAATQPIADLDLRVVLIPAIALVLFNLFKALWDGAFHQKTEEYGYRFWGTFAYYLRRTVMPNLIIGVLACLTFLAIAYFSLRSYFVLSFLLLLFLLALNHLRVAVLVASDQRQRDRTVSWMSVFRRTAHLELSARILRSMGVMAFLIVGNAALSWF